MKKAFFFCFVATIFMSTSYAQKFDDNTLLTTPQPQITTKKQEESFFDKTINTAKNVLNIKQEKPVEKGNATIRRVYQKGQTPNANEDPYVAFLYMEDFKLLKLGGSMTNCSMRFYILTNFDNILNSIDLKLTWPDMVTTVSLIDVVPNQPTFVDYTLMGQGCYTMNKVPNIEVNRCRVKGMSQEQCSSKIRWVK